MHASHAFFWSHRINTMVCDALREVHATTCEVTFCPQQLRQIFNGLQLKDRGRHTTCTRRRVRRAPWAAGMGGGAGAVCAAVAVLKIEVRTVSPVDTYNAGGEALHVVVGRL